jgi:flagellar basal body-associated protein FliL
LAEKNKKSWFGFGKKLTKTEKKERSKAVRNTLIIFIFIFAAVGLTVGFIYMERFVKTSYHFEKEALALKLVNVPDWVSPELIREIEETAKKGGAKFILNESSARLVG